MEDVYRITGDPTNKAPTGKRYGTVHMARKTVEAAGDRPVKVERMTGEFVDVTHEFKEENYE